jgi:hypothetical protein
MPRTPAQSALSIISPETTGGTPPRDLGRHGRKLWDEVQAAYGIRDHGTASGGCKAAHGVVKQVTDPLTAISHFG